MTKGALSKVSTPTLRELLKARLALVREDLEEVLGRLNDELLPWAPREGMRTIRGQIIEIAGTEVQLMTWIRERRQIPYEEAEAFGERSETLVGLKDVLQSVRVETLDYMDSLTEDNLQTPMPFPERWFESLRLPEAPPSEAFRSLAQHEWYHTGQLVSYLWARGDDPYKW